MFRKRAIFSQGIAGLTPADIRKAYNISDNLTGEGQTIAILEFGSGYNLNDIATFAKLNGIENYDLEFVSVGGAANDNGVSPNDMEATLDVEWALALAPKAKIVVYEAQSGDTYQDFGINLVNCLRYVLDDKAHKVTSIGISYGDAEMNFSEVNIYQPFEQLLIEAAAKGISVFISSGDQGAYGEHNLDDEPLAHVDFPASCPHAIAVGGTNLQVNPYTESAWTFYGPQNGGATGGGFSYLFDAPAWQLPALKRYGTNKRGVPDVAAVADPASGVHVIFEGQQQVIGGTSLAAPIWAAITALINQAIGKPAGFFLPQLYANPAALHDITTGNNSFNGVQGYNAEPGWDPCTGLGTPDVGKLIDLLSGKQVESYKDVYTFTDGKAQYTVNDKSIQAPEGTAPKLIKGHMYIPVRTVAQILGAKEVDWDQKTLTATIKV